MKFLFAMKFLLAILRRIGGIPGGIRGIRDVTVISEPCEVCNPLVHKPRSQCCDFLVSCFLTCVLYFFVYFFCFPLTVQCRSDDSSVQVEG